MTTPALQYSVQDRSILLPFYKKYLVEPLLPFIPASISPNAITHGGHILNLGTLLLLLFTAHLGKRWPFFAVAVLVNVYLWCDNADGGHARRTNQCSAKGEFLDHGLDLLNATYVACMSVVTLGAPPFWSVAAAVVVPATAAVTYWEQAETGVFQLGMFNQIEAIFCLTIALIVRGVVGADAIASVHVGGISAPVLVLAVVALSSLSSILSSTMRVAKKRGRLGPAVAPYAFGVAVVVAAATGALGTFALIVAGAVVFIFLGIRQLTLRVRGERPLLEPGVLVAAALLVGLAAYRMLFGSVNADVARSIDWAAAGVVSVLFGGLAFARALEGHREVERLDRRRP